MSRDVELVIKAKDAATSAIDSIKDALKELTGAQEDVGKSAAKTDTLLGDLGSQLRTLTREVAGVTAFGKITGELDKASGAVNRLETNVKTSVEQFSRLAREADKATASANRLRGQIEAERRVIEDTTAARKATAAELRGVNQAVKEAEAAQRRYNNAVKNTPEIKRSSAQRSAGAFVSADLDTAKQRQAALRQEIEGFDQSVKASRRTIQELREQVSAASQNQTKLAKETAKAAGALRNQRTELDNARTGLTAIKDVAGQASSALGGMAIDQNKVSEASAKLAAELARTKARIDALNRTTAAPQSSADLTAQNRATLEAKRSWAEAQAEVKRLAQAFREAAVPSEQLGAALGRAQAQSRLAKEAYEQQQLALHRLRGAAQTTYSAFNQSLNSNAAANRSIVGAAQQAAGGERNLANATRQADTAMRGATTSATGLRGALSGVYGASRQSLSFMQRLRGEVLSLTASYIGLQAAMRALGGAVTAFQTMEAAQSRLGAVFNQDTNQVAKELGFLERQAQRLGIGFDTLSNQYSKFAVAADAANFSGAATRDVFMSVAEAGRVNKLSMDQVNGVFLALEQIISKGKFTSEEVRRQMGDRLPGAFNILADALGYTTAQLDDLMRKGEVLATEENLLKFGDELRKRFGLQLPAALKTTTTELGRFQDNVFQSQLRFGEGGFIEGFTEGLRNLNEWFKSREGRDFFLSMGAAAGKAAEALSVLPQYFDEIGMAITAFAAFKLAGVFTGITNSIRQTHGTLGAATTQFFTWRATVQSVQAQMATFRATLVSFNSGLVSMRAQVMGVTGAWSLATARFAAAQTSLAALRGVMVLVTGTARAMWAALGGLPGIILTGVALAVGSWVTKVDETVSAIDEHRRIMGEVITAYETVKDKTEDWGTAIKGVTLDQVNVNVRRMREEYDKATDAVEAFATSAEAMSMGYESAYNRPGSESMVTIARVRELIAALKSGDLVAKDFTTEIGKLYDNAKSDSIRKFLEQLLQTARKAEGAADNLGGAALAAQKLGSTLDGLADDVERTGVSIESLADANKDTFEDGASAAEQFAEAIRGIKEFIPEMAAELKRLGEIEALNTLYDQALLLAKTMDEVHQATVLYNQALDAIKNKSLGGIGGGGSTLDLIKGFEGFRETPYWDVNALRIGYGSDTVTLADGSIKKVVEGMRVTREDADRDLIRRIGEFQDTVKRQIGSDRFGALSNDQQAAITSIAYNYGRLPERIVDAFKSGSASTIAEAIRGLGSDNAGINRDRRNKEADLFASGGDSYQSQQQLYEIEQKRLKTIEDYNLAFDERISDANFELEIGKMSARDQEIQRALREENNKAIAAGTVLTDAQKQKIIETTGALYDQKNAREEILAAEKQVNDLYTLRQQLLEQQKMAEEQGDVTQVSNLELRLVEINAQLQQAIQNAIAMWQAIGGDEADLAIAKLETTAMSLGNVGNRVVALGLNMGQIQSLVGSFASGLVGVFDAFAKAVANGENAFQALGQAFLQFAADFLRQIATMILQQMILNALAGFGGPIGQAAVSLGGVVRGHTGGVVGPSGIGIGNMRGAPAFGAMMAYHTGGIAGFAPDEVPARLQVGEEILTKDDPRHRGNGGLHKMGQRADASPTTMRNIIVLDDESAANWMSSAAGEQVFLTHIKNNASKVRSIIG